MFEKFVQMKRCPRFSVSRADFVSTRFWAALVVCVLIAISAGCYRARSDADPFTFRSNYINGTWIYSDVRFPQADDTGAVVFFGILTVAAIWRLWEYRCDSRRVCLMFRANASIPDNKVAIIGYATLLLTALTVSFLVAWQSRPALSALWFYSGEPDDSVSVGFWVCGILACIGACVLLLSMPTGWFRATMSRPAGVAWMCTGVFGSISLALGFIWQHQNESCGGDW
jgi:hypothetical protein